jgi:hypothetical protein
MFGFLTAGLDTIQRNICLKSESHASSLLYGYLISNSQYNKPESVGVRKPLGDELVTDDLY